MKNLTRRTLLRGAGAAVALPWLESMTPAFAQSAKPPVRLGFFYVPNGVHMANWRPAEAGELKELPATLKSLDPVKVAMALEGMEFDVYDGGKGSMRKDDHQFFQPMYIASFGERGEKEDHSASVKSTPA